MTIIYQLGGTCQNLFVPKLFGVSIFRDKNSCFLWRLGRFTHNSQDSSGEGQGSSFQAL